MKLTTVAALAGLCDAASFAVSRRSVMVERPERGAGTVAAMGIWSGLAVSAMRGRRGRARMYAAAALLANSAMLAVHARARIANPRIAVGTGLALVALAGTLAGDS